MKTYVRSLFIFILLTSITNSGFAADTQINISNLKRQFETRIKKYTLDNGLRIILMKNGLTPTIACYLKVGVGSANEPFDIAGTAHFLEHLLFKGNETIGTSDFAREKIYLDQIAADGERLDNLRRQLLDPILSAEKQAELKQQIEKLQKRFDYFVEYSRRFVLSEEDSTAYSMAGQVGYNAYTSADVTNYQIKLPKNRLELWAYMESQRFQNPSLREFYAERKVIEEERYMRYDSKPSNLLYELFLKTAYGFSPYGKPVIGFANNIPKMRIQDTRDFFEKNYIPSRMVIAIVGDLEFEETYQTLKKYFSALKSRKEPEFPPIENETQTGRKTANLNARDATPSLITGWHKPSLRHPDDYIFEIISKILTDGQASRLYKRLVIEEKLSPYVYSYNGNPGEKLPNNFSIFAGAFEAKNYGKIYEIIKDELKKIVDHGVEAEELEKVKNQMLITLISALNSNAGLADQLTYYELLLNDYQTFFSLFNKLEILKPQEIQRVIKEYFSEDKNTTVWLNHP